MNEAQKEEQEETAGSFWRLPRTRPSQSREVSPCGTIKASDMEQCEDSAIARDSKHRANRFAREREDSARSITTSQHEHMSRGESVEHNHPPRTASRTSPLDLTRTTERAHRPISRRSGTDLELPNDPPNRRVRSPLADILSPPPRALTRSNTRRASGVLSRSPHPLAREASSRRGSDVLYSPPPRPSIEEVSRRASGVQPSSANGLTTRSVPKETVRRVDMDQCARAVPEDLNSYGISKDGISPKDTSRTFSQATTSYECSTEATLSKPDIEQYVDSTSKRESTDQAHEPEDQHKDTTETTSQDSTSTISTSKFALESPLACNDADAQRERASVARDMRRCSGLIDCPYSPISRARMAKRHSQYRRMLSTECGESCETSAAMRSICPFCAKGHPITTPQFGRQASSPKATSRNGQRLNSDDYFNISLCAVLGLFCTGVFLYCIPSAIRREKAKTLTVCTPLSSMLRALLLTTFRSSAR